MKALFPLLLATLAASASAQVTADRPPPPIVFEPRPGPWFIFFKPGSTELADERQLQNVQSASRWGWLEGGRLLICYDSTLDSLGVQRLRALALALRDAGADRIVVDNGWLCDQLRPFGEHLHSPRELPSDSALIYGLWDLD